MFRIKICGITQAVDAQQAAGCGADAIGLNFCASSKRVVDLRRAARIVAATPKSVARVGVFVNASAEQLLAAAEAVPLDIIQLHGDEPAELIGQLAPWPVIRAVRWSDQTVPQLLDQWADSGAAALLVDGYSARSYGGGGQTVDWELARQLADELPLPLLLAGGLKADNVAEAARTVRPAGVDVASGVESAPGVKDPQLVERFVDAALRQLQQNDESAADR